MFSIICTVASPSQYTAISIRHHQKSEWVGYLLRMHLHFNLCSHAYEINGKSKILFVQLHNIRMQRTHKTAIGRSFGAGSCKRSNEQNVEREKILQRNNVDKFSLVMHLAKSKLLQSSALKKKCHSLARYCTFCSFHTACIGFYPFRLMIFSVEPHHHHRQH